MQTLDNFGEVCKLVTILLGGVCKLMTIVGSMQLCDICSNTCTVDEVNKILT